MQENPKWGKLFQKKIEIDVQIIEPLKERFKLDSGEILIPGTFNNWIKGHIDGSLKNIREAKMKIKNGFIVWEGLMPFGLNSFKLALVPITPQIKSVPVTQWIGCPDPFTKARIDGRWGNLWCDKIHHNNFVIIVTE